MPPIMFEDSQPQPKGVRLGDLKERDTYLPYPCSPLSKVVEVLGQTADNRTIIRGFDGAISGKCDANEIVYPVSVKMVRADAPGCDATKQIVEDAQALRAELDAAKGQYAALKREVERVADARNVWMGAAEDHKADADKLRVELQKAKTSKEEAERRVRAVSTDLGWMTLARNNWMAAHDRVADERDAWKARAEAYTKKVAPVGTGGFFFTVDSPHVGYSCDKRAAAAFDKANGIPPAPTTTDPERVTQDQPNHKRFS